MSYIGNSSHVVGRVLHDGLSLCLLIHLDIIYLNLIDLVLVDYNVLIGKHVLGSL